MPKHDFRGEARAAIARARGLMADQAELPALRYAALEARTAMEALTYDRAQAYERDLPKSEISTWPPKKVLTVLLSLDPLADTGKSFSMSEKPSTGTPEDFEDMFDFGTETVLNLKVIKKHYDAIGYRLHMPTIKQLEEEGQHDPIRLRTRLNELLMYLEKVIASPVFNITMMGPNTQLPCVRCSHIIRRAIKENSTVGKARCPECSLGYDLKLNEDGGFDWYPERATMKCATTGCPEELTIYRNDLRVGAVVRCNSCQENTLIVFGSRHFPQIEGKVTGPILQVKLT